MGTPAGKRVGGWGRGNGHDPVGGPGRGNQRGEQEGLAPWGRDVIFSQINKTHGR
jgi:hypothetical protein